MAGGCHPDGGLRRRRGRDHARVHLRPRAEGMSYKLTGNDMAQIAGLTASFSATFFVAVFAYCKGRND